MEQEWLAALKEIPPKHVENQPGG
ncbi:hypothetical protein CGLO_10814 [Colletotrichum gloeosporioides Cg-14]|uniref:Uncharacterized protein n=1 Tax=Colletotrichum gloeosporioides (strain Cg-14) TaxID=1237896 RepID=T0KCH6_COLGC|nr:hypothetical protein CGLO_10814 [Colletotrichum gloeosporioides Cg-14]